MSRSTGWFAAALVVAIGFLAVSNVQHVLASGGTPTEMGAGQAKGGTHSCTDDRQPP
jgi:hypothetical protein